MGGGYGGYSGGHSYGGWSGGHSYSGQMHSNISPSQHNFSTNASHGDWNHGHYGDWNHGWNYGHSGWNHNWAWWHNYGPYWYGGWGFGFWWPWYGFAWWPGYYDYCYGVPYADYGYAVADNVTPYVAYMPQNAGPDVTAPGAEAESPPEAGGQTDETFDFYGRAAAAFAQGEFRDATHLAAHAAVDDPRSQKVHLLLSLGLFATGEYRGAAIEAHAVASLGKVPDWPTVYGLYNNVDTYTTHLRALEKYVRDKPSSAEARFLLGFQYMMAGHTDAARDEFLKALKLAPKDRLAARLLKEEGGTVPPEIAKQLAELPVSQDMAAPKLPPPPAPHAPPTK
jgi:tetratricopeptide (TPR) repeat protein